MDESATELVAEIERIRSRLDGEISELRGRVPKPDRIAAAAAGTAVGVMTLRWLARRHARILYTGLAIGAAIVGWSRTRHPDIADDIARARVEGPSSGS